MAVVKDVYQQFLDMRRDYLGLPGRNPNAKITDENMLGFAANLRSQIIPDAYIRNITESQRNNSNPQDRRMIDTIMAYRGAIITLVFQRVDEAAQSRKIEGLRAFMNRLPEDERPYVADFIGRRTESLNHVKFLDPNDEIYRALMDLRNSYRR